MAADPARTGPVRTALSWLTVVPVRAPRGTPDRIDGGRVIAVVPVLGVLLGVVAAALAYGLDHTRLPSLIIGALVVAALALVTRGMHLDGLADTADGLGCYGDPERTRAVMRSGDAGPFGAATLALVILLQASAIGALASAHHWYAIAFAILLGRVAVVIACRTGLPPSSPDGFGALVAGTQHIAIGVWLLVAAGGAVGAGWLGGPSWSSAFEVRAAVVAGIACAAVSVFAYGFTRHCARRTGGISGDVLRATLELSTTLALLVLLV